MRFLQEVGEFFFFFLALRDPQPCWLALSHCSLSPYTTRLAFGFLGCGDGKGRGKVEWIVIFIPSSLFVNQSSWVAFC